MLRSSEPYRTRALLWEQGRSTEMRWPRTANIICNTLEPIFSRVVRGLQRVVETLVRENT